MIALKGAVVYPGFHDSHNHLMYAALGYTGIVVVEEGASRYYSKRMKDSYPITKIINAGISTDFIVSPFSLSPVLIVLKTSMQSKYNPITIKQLIKGLTEGSSATSSYRDTGSLDVGNWADMIVFDRDLYNVNPTQLTDSFVIRHLATWVGGRRVY